jgi:hypothetical protein
MAPPIFAFVVIDTLEPIFPKALKLIEEPSFRKSKMLAALLRRPKLLMETELDRDTVSIVESLLPSCARGPKIETLDPSLAYARNETEDPTLIKLNVDSVLPRRPKLRIEHDEPRLNESIIDTLRALPTATNP